MDARGEGDRPRERRLRRWTRAARARCAAAVRGPLRWLATTPLPRYHPSNGPYLVLAPHPDDESLGCGGTIAALRSNGIAVTVVVVTDGSGSDLLGRERDTVVKVRRHEVIAACAELGVDEDHVQLLGLPDGELEQRATTLDRLLEDTCRRIQPAEILVCTALDRHPDHQALNAACHRVVAPGARVTEYLVWAWATWPLSAFRFQRERAGLIRAVWRTFATLGIARRHPLGAALDAKGRAVHCHRSQIGDGAPGRGIPRSMVSDHLSSSEILLTVRRGIA